MCLQVDPKIFKELEDQRLCIERTRCKSQCGTFQRDTEGPHPGAGESCDGYTSQQNIHCAAHEDDIGGIKPSRSPHRETRNITNRELPAGKIGTSFNTGQARPSVVQQFGPVRSNFKPRPKCVLQKRKMFDSNGYCSSHGYKVEEAHTSAVCRFPKNGHNKLYTQLYIKGGQTWNNKWINGRPTE